MNDSGLRPTAFNVVVRMDTSETVTPGGIILPEKVAERDKLAVEEGELVALSPHAFSYADNWPEPHPQVGDRVLIRRYDGLLRERGGRDYRIVEDKSVVAVIEPAVKAVSAAA